MNKFSLILFCALICCKSYAQKSVPNPYLLKPSGDWMKTKNYYLLTLFEQDKEVNALLKSDTALSRLTLAKIQGLNNSIKDCKDATCFTSQIKFSDDEIKTVNLRLKALYKPNGALERLTKNVLIPSGTYSLYKNLPPAEQLIKAWEQDAGAVNYAISVYAEGKKPNYPLIDSISYNVKAKNYTTIMYDCAVVLSGDVKSTKLFFEPSLQAALLYLQINERQDPANYEPMETTVNKAAVEKIKTIKWASYPYSNILVPGAGPDNLTTPLSGEGMLRCRLAAQQYQLGQAPLIMVSGGNVHPYKNTHNEALEMKKYLMQTLHIPESAIIMDPHARHTTTNMRNCARLIYRYGIPADKPGIVITDRSQTTMVINMAARCEKELNYVPYKLSKRLSDTAVEYYPVTDALQIDPDEPLDPR